MMQSCLPWSSANPACSRVEEHGMTELVWPLSNERSHSEWPAVADGSFAARMRLLYVLLQLLSGTAGGGLAFLC